MQNTSANEFYFSAIIKIEKKKEKKENKKKKNHPKQNFSTGVFPSFTHMVVEADKRHIT